MQAQNVVVRTYAGGVGHAYRRIHVGVSSQECRIITMCFASESTSTYHTCRPIDLCFALMTCRKDSYRQDRTFHTKAHYVKAFKQKLFSFLLAHHFTGCSGGGLFQGCTFIISTYTCSIV